MEMGTLQVPPLNLFILGVNTKSPNMHLAVKAKGEEIQKSALSILHFFGNWSTNKTITQFSVTCFCNREFDFFQEFFQEEEYRKYTDFETLSKINRSRNKRDNVNYLKNKDHVI